MASLSYINGVPRIQYHGQDGRRRTLYLGRCPKREAETIKVHVVRLASAAMNNAAPPDDTTRWLNGIGAKLHTKLAAAGLVKPRSTQTLLGWLDEYLGAHAARKGLKASTKARWGRDRKHIAEFFRDRFGLHDVTIAKLQEFDLYLRTTAGLAEATARRTNSQLSQVLRAAARRGMIASNPYELADIARADKANDDRLEFIDHQTIEKVIAVCPDVEWRLMVALARYGGLRVPSEPLKLEWGHVDWAKKRMTVPSPKTEHHEGRAFRVIPIFPELLPHLEAAFHAAPEGAVHVIQRYRSSAVNLRTSLLRYLARAGVAPWPRLWQNLRSSRETELAETWPLHVVTKWFGNTEAIAKKHYLQVTDEHYERAAAGLSAAAGTTAVDSPSSNGKVDAKFDALPRRCVPLHESAPTCEPPSKPAPKSKRITQLRRCAQSPADWRIDSRITKEWALLGLNSSGNRAGKPVDEQGATQKTTHSLWTTLRSCWRRCRRSC
jgi:integrase